MMRALLQDLRYALRQMRHAPGFSIGVIVVLALGIGANAAMFTVLEGTLFRPLAYQDAGRLVQLEARNVKGGSAAFAPLADVRVWTERTHTLESIAYYDLGQAYLMSHALGETAIGQQVADVSGSANLDRTIGVAPALGRWFSEQEQQPGRDSVVVLSDAVWRSQFNADAGVLGKTIGIDDARVTVIGVMPAGFSFPAQSGSEVPEPQIWRPAALVAKDLTRLFEARAFQLIGRRRKGASIQDVSTELSSIQKTLAPLYTVENAEQLVPVGVRAVDYRRSLHPEDQRKALLALLGAVAVLWMIACANVTCLMLARTAARRREMAVRSALGAGRWRLMRQLLAESLLLALAGGALGVGLAMAVLRMFRHSLETQLSAGLSLRPDTRVLLALFALSVLSAV